MNKVKENNVMKLKKIMVYEYTNVNNLRPLKEYARVSS